MDSAMSYRGNPMVDLLRLTVFHNSLMKLYPSTLEFLISMVSIESLITMDSNALPKRLTEEYFIIHVFSVANLCSPTVELGFENKSPRWKAVPLKSILADALQSDVICLCIERNIHSTIQLA
mmetsp:Transcript_22319/g.31994  ORF Transcript_22319/g.31994 Transcript_22319/m.31994 type:complete len:122 (-) Transcript_22319:107-472(-)